jgi:hypothetical protein
MNSIYGSDNFKNKIKQYEALVKESDKDLEIQIHKNALVIPYKNRGDGIEGEGGVFDSNGKIIELSKSKTSNSIIKIGSPQILDADIKYKYIDEDAVYLGFFPTHFGHFIIEALNRLWIYLENNPFDIQAAAGGHHNLFNKKAVYIGASDSYFIEILEIFGFDKKNIIRVDEPTKFKSVIIPEESAFILEPICNKKYKDIYKRIRDNAAGYGYEKIYLSRTKLSRLGKVCGEEEIEKAFEENGFKVIYSEKMSLAKQIGLMKNCKHLAGLTGSSLYLSLFAADGIEAAQIYRSEGTLKLHIKINKIKGIKNAHIQADARALQPVPISFGYLISSKSQYMQDYLKDMNYIKDYASPIAYLNKEYDIVQLIGKKEFKKWKLRKKWIIYIQDRLLMLMTNFIPVKSIRKKLRYRLINR